MGHGTKEPIRWSTISPGLYHSPPYWEGIGRHATLIMANPLTIGRVFKIRCTSQSHKLRNLHNLTNCTGSLQWKGLKVVKHVQSKSLTSLLITQMLGFHNDKRYSRSFICYEGILSEPRGTQKFMNYVWNSDQYHLTSVIKNPSGSLRSVMPAASGFLNPRLYTGYIGIFTYYYYLFIILILFFYVKKCLVFLRLITYLHDNQVMWVSYWILKI